ncbi:hypothetical protein ACJX0J_004896 (mitochondrion) [Zea mays]
MYLQNAYYTRTAATLISVILISNKNEKGGFYLPREQQERAWASKGKNALYLFQYRLERNAKQRNEQTSDTLEGLPGMREQHGYTTLNPSLLASQNCDRLHHNSLTGPIYPKIAIRFPLSAYSFSMFFFLLYPGLLWSNYYTKQSEQGATVPVVENWRSCIGNWPYNSTIGKEAFKNLDLIGNFPSPFFLLVAGSCLARQPLSPCLTPFKMFCYVWFYSINRLFDLYDRNYHSTLRGCINRIKMFIITEGHIIVESFSCCCYFLVGKFR